jgi:predicted metal-dependent hydrolase
MKTDIMKFIIKNSSHYTFHAGYKEKYKEETSVKTNMHLHTRPLQSFAPE